MLMIDSSRHLLHRETLAAASAIYKGMVESYSLGALTTRNLELHGQEDGTVPATFQVIYLVSYIYCATFVSLTVQA
jgi:NADH dehydrogenase [ubiquinone] 1 alpha subcomplex assembly factor 5